MMVFGGGGGGQVPGGICYWGQMSGHICCRLHLPCVIKRRSVDLCFRFRDSLTTFPESASVPLLHAFNHIYCKSNKAIVDIRLRPLSSAAHGGSCLSIRRGVKSRCPLLSHFEYTLLSCRQFLTVTCKYEVIHKPKVHKLSQRRPRDQVT